MHHRKISKIIQAGRDDYSAGLVRLSRPVRRSIAAAVIAGTVAAGGPLIAADTLYWDTSSIPGSLVGGNGQWFGSTDWFDSTTDTYATSFISGDNVVFADTLATTYTITNNQGSAGLSIGNVTVSNGNTVTLSTSGSNTFWNFTGSNGISIAGASSFTLNINSTIGNTTSSGAGPIEYNGSASTSSRLPITLSGSSTFGLTNASGTTGNKTVYTTISSLPGDNTVAVTDKSTSSASLTLSTTISRSVGGTINFVEGGSVVPVINGTASVAGFLNNGQGFFFGGADYAYSNGTGGQLRAPNYGTDGATAVNGGATSLTAGDYDELTSSNTASQPAVSINTLKIGGGSGEIDLSLASGAVLTLAKGGLLRSGGGPSIISGDTGMQSGSGVELVIRTDAAADNLTINTPILDNGSTILTKSGAGTLVLGANNTYGGGTYLDGGILSLNSANPLGATTIGTITFSGGTLQFTANNTTDYSPSFSTAPGQQYSFDTNGQNVALAAALTSSNATFAKSGSGILALTGANTFNGNVQLNGGEIGLASAETGTSGPLGEGGIISFGGGALQYTAVNSNDYSGRFSNAANQQYAINTNGQSAVIATPLSSAGGSFTKMGAGILTLDAVNTFSGGANLVGGELSVNVPENATPGTGGPLGTSGTISFLGGTLQFTANNTTDYSPRFSNAANQAYNIDSNGQAVTLASALTSSGGSLAKSGDGTLVLTGTNTYSGLTSVTAGTLQVGSGGTSGLLPGAASVASGATLAWNRSDAISYSGALAGSGNVTQLGGTGGTGTLSLTGAGSFSGTLTAAGGTLVVQPGVVSAAASVVVNDGASFALVNPGPTSLSVNNLTLGAASGATLQFTLNGTPSVAPLASGGTLTVNGVTTIDVINSGSALSVGDIPLLQYTGTPAGTGSFQLGTLPARTTAKLVTYGSTLDLDITSTGAPIYWTGSHSPDWDINTTSNWKTGGSPTTYLQASAPGDAVVFDDADNTGNQFNVNLTTTLQPVSVGVNNSTNPYVFSTSSSGSIAGSASLTKTGTSSLTLDTANTYTGLTTIGQGTLILGIAGALPAGASVVLGDGNAAHSATFDLNGQTQQLASLSVAAGSNGSNQVIGNGSNTNNSSLIYASGAPATFAGTIQDNVGGGSGTNVALTVSGGGLLTLSGANTYTGGTSISNGTLVVGSAAAFPAATSLVLGGAGTSGTLDLNGNTASVAGLAIDSNATAASQIIGNGSSSSNATLAYSGAGTSSFAGTIQNNVGAGSGTTTALGVTGGGSLTLSGTNTYTGGTSVSNGTLIVGSAGAFPAGTPLTLGGNGTIGTLDLNGRIIAVSGLALGSGASAAGQIIGNSSTTAAATLIYSSPSASTFGGTIQNALGSGTKTVGLTVQGDGSLTLNGPDTYTGTTTIGNGTLILGTSNGSSTGSLNPATAVTLGDASNHPGYLQLGDSSNPVNQTIASLIINSANTGAGGGVFGGNAAAASTLTINNSATDSFSGILGGSTPIQNNLNLVKTGTGTLTLSGANTFAGSATLIEGEISLTVANAGLKTASSITLGDQTGVSTATDEITSSANETYSNPIYVVGTNQTNTLNHSSNTVTVSGAVTLENSNFTLSGAGASAATTTLTGGITGAGNVTIANTSSGSSYTVSNQPINNSGTLTYTGSGADTVPLTISAAIGYNVTAVTQSHPSSPLILSGQNTYSGPTNVTAGILRSGIASSPGVYGAFGLNSAVSLGNAAGVTLDLNGFDTQIGSLTGSGNVTLGTATLTLGGDNTSPAPFAGAISGAGGLTKIGGGVQTLAGVNAYGGPTTVNGGTLLINGALNGSPVAVNTGGTLAGTGTIAGSNTANGVVVGQGGAISAGNGLSTTGQLTTTGGDGNSTFSQVWTGGNAGTGGTYDWKLNTNNAGTTASGTTADPGGAGANWDLLTLSTLNVTSPAGSQFNIVAIPVNGPTGTAFNPSNPYSWAIADITSGSVTINGRTYNPPANPGDGTALLASLAAVLSINAAALPGYSNNYSIGVAPDGGSGEDIVINYAPAPEPGGMALLGLGAACLLARQRRR